ncbi:cytochrome ubiquinol oxidase subunit I [Nanoarchaeota archaeon]
MINMVNFDAALTGFSLAVHIIFASIGIALPIIIAIAEFIAIKYKSKYYDILSKRLTKAFAVFFAVGTASGIVVAIELLILWPKFMSLVSKVAILPLYIEVFAFFTESILLSIYIYLWDRFKSRIRHWILIIFIALGASSSGLLITMINAFMNTPVGFNIPYYLSTGKIIDVNPFAVFNTPTTWVEIGHVIFSSIFTASSLFLAYASYKILKSNGVLKEYYKKLAKISGAVVIVSLYLTGVYGILSIHNLMVNQPEKYAALELNFNYGPNVPEVIGGILVNNSVIDAIYIPGLMSYLATGSFNGVIPKQDTLLYYNQSTWPPVSFVHNGFDFMAILGFVEGAFFLIVTILWIINIEPIKKKIYNKLPKKIFSDPFDSPLFLKLFIVSGILSLILLEDGWITAEVGRVPWIIYNVMTIAEAANTSPSIIPIGIAMIIFYIAIIPLTFWFIKEVLKRENLEKELEEE